jgi:hypothetical protein
MEEKALKKLLKSRLEDIDNPEKWVDVRVEIKKLKKYHKQLSKRKHDSSVKTTSIAATR